MVRERESKIEREKKKEKVGQRDIDNMIEKGCLTYVWNVYFQDNISIWLTFIHIQVNIYIFYVNGGEPPSPFVAEGVQLFCLSRFRNFYPLPCSQAWTAQVGM